MEDEKNLSEELSEKDEQQEVLDHVRLHAVVLDDAVLQLGAEALEELQVGVPVLLEQPGQLGLHLLLDVGPDGGQLQILSLLKNNWGLERMSSEGQPFDPQTMEAYQAEEVEGLEKETVLQVYQEGYILNGKVIRTSKVKVGKPKA